MLKNKYIINVVYAWLGKLTSFDKLIYLIWYFLYIGVMLLCFFIIIIDVGTNIN